MNDSSTRIYVIGSVSQSSKKLPVAVSLLLEAVQFIERSNLVFKILPAWTDSNLVKMPGNDGGLTDLSREGQSHLTSWHHQATHPQSPPGLALCLSHFHFLCCFRIEATHSTDRLTYCLTDWSMDQWTDRWADWSCRPSCPVVLRWFH